MKNLQLLGFSVSKLIQNTENACMSIDVDTGYVYIVSTSHLIGYAPITQTVSTITAFTDTGYIIGVRLRIRLY
jgi:hypothetical protein